MCTPLAVAALWHRYRWDTAYLWWGTGYLWSGTLTLNLNLYPTWPQPPAAPAHNIHAGAKFDAGGGAETSFQLTVA